MGRINTNLTALSVFENLNRVNRELTGILARLSSGQAIDTAADNPAGLIISEQLRAELGALQTQIDSAERSAGALTTAEGALGQISEVLIDLRRNALAAANTAGVPAEATELLQSQADQAVEAIDRIAASTTFGSQPLLGGDYTIRLGVEEITLGAADAANIATESPAGSLAGIATGGAAPIGEDIAQGLAVIDQAIVDVALRRGQIGGFAAQQVTPAIEQFSVALENVTAANSDIRDADFAVELANLARTQLLQETGTSLAAMANMTSDSVLRLLSN